MPPVVEDLISSGCWPTTEEEARRQNLEPVVSAERISAVAADEVGLHLCPPPFRSVASDIAVDEERGWNFWAEYGALHEIDPSQALIIGDFGPGSDAPILLDYRHDPDPCVIKLAWSPGGSPASKPTTTWVRIADSLDDFARRLGLT